MDDDLTVDVEADDGSTDTFAVPATLLDQLSEGDEPAALIVADVAVMGFAGRAHALVHHADGEPDADLEAAERAMLDAFEDRFGMTYAEATGHSH